MTHTVLVTGATGYIGSHICKELGELGFTVHALDYNFEQNDVSQYVTEQLHIDINHVMYSDLAMYYDTVIHLAAMTKVHLSTQIPRNYYQTNTIGTYNVAQVTSCGHFIYCSTGAAFNPTSSPYAMSKRAGEDMMHYTDGYSICRFYNVSGNDGFIRHEDAPSHLIISAAKAAVGKKDFLEIYGTDYETRDGTCIRNYTHIKDIVDGVMSLVYNGPTNSIQCLGSRDGYTVREVIDTMKEVSGVDFKVVEGKRRTGDVPISTLPAQSRFFAQRHTLADQCLSALESEL